MQHTTPASIAAAIRRAADDIEAMGDIELSPINVHLDLQAVHYQGTPQARRQAVDVLSYALTGYSGACDEGAAHYSLKYEGRFRRDGVDVAVYTNLTDADHHPTRHVCDPAELTEVRLSKCEAGCKVMVCGGCDVEQVVHSVAYGCTEAGAR